MAPAANEAAHARDRKRMNFMGFLKGLVGPKGALPRQLEKTGLREVFHGRQPLARNTRLN
jgi:hypothetical protein